MSGECLTEETILGFRDLPPEARAQAEVHASSCDECRQLLSIEAQSGGAAPSLAFEATENMQTPGHNAAPLFSREEGEDAVHVGSLLAGKYRVEGLLGSGGMGIVVAATHTQLGQKVALKFLQRRAAQDSGMVERFLREAKAAVRLRSEHVARVLDVGTFDGGAPFIVMEFLDGVDLSRVLRERGQLPVSEAIDFIVQASEAIAEAHAVGIVHRDIKPANLFLTTKADGSPHVKVLDFGISKFDVPGGNATTADVAMGSPRYMSPEQMQSARDVDARTDVWALGIVLYELLSGRPPFEADSFVALCAKVATGTPPPLSTWRADIPVEMEAVIGAALQKNVDQRTASVAAFVESLRAIASDEARRGIDRVLRVAKAPSRISHAPLDPTPPDVATDAALSRTASRSRGRTALGLFGVGAAIVTLVVMGKLFAPRAPHRAAAPASPVPVATVPAEIPATAASIEIVDLGTSTPRMPATAPAASASARIVPKKGGSPKANAGERNQPAPSGATDLSGLSDRK